MSINKAVFLDRDGVLIEDKGYQKDTKEIVFLPGVVDSIRLLNLHRYLVVVVTNQAGVAKGYVTEKEVKNFNICIKSFLSKQSAFIERFYYCPHHPSGTVKKYTKTCYCRKPNPGMLGTAAMDLKIDLRNSYMIGDQIWDIEAGKTAYCKTVLITDKDSNSGVEPNYIARNLYKAVQWIVRR